jgi:N-acetylmuramoyl-L-alanine amidase
MAPLAVAALLLLLAPISGQSPQSRRLHFENVRLVCLDPGHGGANHGAWTSIGVHEKDLTLPLAKAVRDHLIASTDLEVVLTREGDDALTLPERAAYANRVGADLFISLHLNSTEGTIADGVETFFLAESATDEEAERVAAAENFEPEATVGAGRFERRAVDRIVKTLVLRGAHLLAGTLATQLQKAMVKETGLRNRGVKSARFGVLRGLEMPGVVLELGFASNPSEVEFITSPEYTPRLQKAVFDAVVQMEKAFGGD